MAVPAHQIDFREPEWSMERSQTWIAAIDLLPGRRSRRWNARRWRWRNREARMTRWIRCRKPSTGCVQPPRYTLGPVRMLESTRPLGRHRRYAPLCV